MALPLFIPTESSIEAEALYDAIEDAPVVLSAASVQLLVRPSRKVTGQAFARAEDGRAYKVRVVEIHADPSVWKRWARIRYDPVPQVEAGGHLDLGTPPELAKVGAAALDVLTGIADAPRIPGDSFRAFLRPGSEYVALSDLPPELELRDRPYVVLPERLATSVTTTRYSGVVATAGIAPEGKVTIRSYTGVAVEGDMEGQIDVRSYAYVHITGNLVGTLRCGSYATVWIGGDLQGQIVVRSYTKLYVRGRMRDHAACIQGTSSGSTYFLDGFTSEREVRGVSGGGATLHLRDSDLPVGANAVRGWREVVVGAPLWRDLH